MNPAQAGQVPGGRALLLFPPQWSPQNPHYALRSIAGHLRSRGIEVALRDLNIEYYDHVLTPEYLTAVRDRLVLLDRYVGTQVAVARELGGLPRKLELDVVRHRAYLSWLAEHPDGLEPVIAQVGQAKDTLRDPERFYRPDLLVPALAVLDRALEAMSLLFFPARLALNFFELPGCEMTVDSLIAHATDREINPFHDWFAAQVPSLLEGSPHYVGISINAFSQVLPGLTLAYLLKKAAPEGVHVGIGGNFFVRVREVLAERPAFFETFADSIAFGEGEYTSAVLVEALARGDDPDGVPNLLFAQVGEGGQTAVVRTPDRSPPPMDAVGKQDLAGLPLDRYFTPELVLTIQSSKSCYWARCTFCDSYVAATPDAKSLDILVDEIRHLRDTYGVRHLQFIDEAISPARMRAMAERFIAEKLDVTWFCNGRLESRFTPALLELLFRAGLRMVLWGFETGSPRIFKLIRKGVPFDRRLPILRAASEAGIWNFAYVFFGFPTETWDDAVATIDVICENKDVLHSYGRSVFTLGKHAPLFAEHEKLGLVDVVEDREELSTNLHYRDTRGMQAEQLEEAMKQCTRRCGQAYEYGLWFFLRYRENIHLYVSRFGREWVSDYRLLARQGIPVEQYY